MERWEFPIRNKSMRFIKDYNVLTTLLMHNMYKMIMSDVRSVYPTYVHEIDRKNFQLSLLKDGRWKKLGAGLMPVTMHHFLLSALVALKGIIRSLLLGRMLNSTFLI